jgi:hypothetical protein
LANIEQAEKDAKKGDGNVKALKNRENDIDTAFSYFSSACVEQADFAMAYFKRGQCYMMMNDFKRALYDFSGAILN